VSSNKVFKANTEGAELQMRF
ncbi:unnamed protein product, partial [Rotaria socialis]